MQRAESGALVPRVIGRWVHDYLAETIVISVGFYVVLYGLLVVLRADGPSLEILFLALFPFLVLLVVSGRIEEFRFGDLTMKFQQAAQELISPDIEEEIIPIEVQDASEKAGPGRLAGMIEEQHTTLAFRLGLGYSLPAIKEYFERNFEQNPSFQYVIFTDVDRRFRGLMDAGDFGAFAWLQAEPSMVLDAIETGAILDEPSVVKTQIQHGSTWGEARRKMDATDRDTLVVVDEDERFVGVLTRERVGEALLSRVIGD